MFDKSAIKLIGFDLDQTLYAESKETHLAYRKALYQMLGECLKIDPKEAERLFIEGYAKLGSGTETVRALGIKNSERFSAEVSNIAQQHLFLTRDEKLLELIEYLQKSYVLFLITASGEKSSYEKLEKLGVVPDIAFAYKIFGDSQHGGKTRGRSFAQLIALSGRHPEEHLYVGDREAADILPAKKAGMRTAMAWSNSRLADFSIPTIYDLKKWV